MDSVKIIKIGGKVIDEEAKLDAFLKDFAAVEGPKVLVHGGGSIASDMSRRMGIEPKLTEGRRITDAATLEVITMVYGGLVSKNIVAKLQALGANAAGLSGADLNLISAHKRPAKPLDFGWVGDVDQVNTSWLRIFFEQGTIPVLAPLTHDGHGHLLNTNADTIASAVASALAKELETELMYCFEQPGVMKNEQLITEMNLLLYRHLKDSGVITDGMIPKLDLGFSALKNGVRNVSVRSYQAVHQITSGTELVS